MNLYQMFKTNPSLESEGILVEYGMNAAGLPIRIRVGRSGGSNSRFSKGLEKATRPHRRAISSGTIDNSLAEQLYREVFAEHVVLGWENVELADGTPLPYSHDNAVKLLNELPDLYADLKEQASNAALFREELRSSDLGNSGPSLNTDSIAEG